MSDLALPWQGRAAPGHWASAVLALGMHLLLAAVLVYGIRWQIKVPEAVEVELVRSLPDPVPEPSVTPPAIEPPPSPAPEPPPAPAKRAEPPPTPKAPPEVAKPDIAIKAKPKKPDPPKPVVKKPEPKPVPKPAPVPEAKPLPPRRDPLQELQQQEDKRLAQAREQQAIERELDKIRQTSASTQRASATDAWKEKITRKIRGNIVLPPNVRGNPQAVFAVTLLPSGDVLNVRLTSSSGNSSLDTAIERAIRKSSPLPKPAQADVFDRDLSLEFKPTEE